MRATQSAWKSPVSGTGSGEQSGIGASSGPDSHAATPPVVDVDVDADADAVVEPVVDVPEVVMFMPPNGPMPVVSPPALVEFA
jgi:hypothetical protein